MAKDWRNTRSRKWDDLIPADVAEAQERFELERRCWRKRHVAGMTYEEIAKSEGYLSVERPRQLIRAAERHRARGHVGPAALYINVPAKVIAGLMLETYPELQNTSFVAFSPGDTAPIG